VLVRLPVDARSVRLRGHADANFPPCAAGRVPERAARLLHPPRRCAVRTRRRAAVRPGGPVATAPEPGAGLPTRLGQRLRRPHPRAHRHRAAARPPGGQLAGRRPASVRRGCDHLAALRRRVLAKPWLLLPPLAPLGRPTDRGRLGLPVDRPARLRPRLLDGPGGRPPAASLGRHRPASRSPDPRAAGAAACRWTAAVVCVRRRLRLRPAHLGPGRHSRSGVGAAAL
jgi:hypothetical protein